MSRRRREQESEATRLVAARAVRRLDLLEWVILVGAALMAATGGFFVGLLASAALGWPFRPTWVVASLVLFGVPGAIAVRRVRRDEREIRAKIDELNKKAHG